LYFLGLLLAIALAPLVIILTFIALPNMLYRDAIGSYRYGERKRMPMKIFLGFLGIIACPLTIFCGYLFLIGYLLGLLIEKCKRRRRFRRRV